MPLHKKRIHFYFANTAIRKSKPKPLCNAYGYTSLTTDIQKEVTCYLCKRIIFTRELNDVSSGSKL